MGPRTRAQSARISSSRRSSAPASTSRTAPSSKRSTSAARNPSITSWRADASSKPAGAQIEELLGIHLGDRGRVRAAHVVRLDLQSGDRVRMRALGDQQVARLLEGVGLLGAGVDDDVALPDGAGAALQNAAEGEVGGRVLRRVLLRRVEVDVLAAVGGVCAGDAGVGALDPLSRVSIRTRPFAEPNPSATQSSDASRPTSARWAPKIQLCSESAWPHT